MLFRSLVMICTILIEQLLESWEISSRRFLTQFYPVQVHTKFMYRDWETTWTVVNMTSVPVRMYVAPALNVTSEVDSQTEAENFPGVVIRDITHNDGSQNKVSVKVRGSVKDIYPSSNKDRDFAGTYGSSPNTSVFGTLCLASGDGTTALNCFVSIKHVFNVRLESQDAIVS